MNIQQIIVTIIYLSLNSKSTKFTGTQLRTRVPITITMVQLNLNFTHVCGYMHARTCFTRVKIYNVECILFAPHSFVVRTCAIKQS